MSDPRWKIAFVGTNHPAVPTLRQLAQHGWVGFVVLPESAGVKNDDLLRIIEEYSLPFSYNIRDLDESTVNLLIAANYPKLVPTRLLESVPCVNTHWSPLPKYRGVHGTAWGLLNGDDEFTVSVHWMEGEFDTGDIIEQRSITLTDSMTLQQLHEALAELQASMLIDLLENHDQAQEFPRIPQNHAEATYVPQRLPEDGIIDWTWPAWRIERLVRALPPPDYPGAFTFQGSRKLIVWQAEAVDGPSYFSTPGQVVRVLTGEGVWVKTGDHCLWVKQAQWDGEATPTSADTLLKRGDKLGVDPQLTVPALLARIAELEERLGVGGSR